MASCLVSWTGTVSVPVVNNTRIILHRCIYRLTPVGRSDYPRTPQDTPGQPLSLSMCIHNFITIFHSVQEIAPLRLFQNLELGKASTDEKCHFAISWARSCQYQCLRNKLSKYSAQFKRYGNFHFFGIWRSAKPRPMINDILQFLELDLVNINVSAKFYQTIPNGLRVKFHCFQNLNLGKNSTNPKCHLTISWAASCQYQCVCKISTQYSTQFKR